MSEKSGIAHYADAVDMSKRLQTLPLRDEAPYRRLERGMRRLELARVELASAHADLLDTMAALHDQGLVVALAESEAPMMDVE